MTLLAALVGYAVLLLAVGPVALDRLTGSGHAPRWAIASWLSALGGAAFSLAVAGGLALVELGGHWAGRPAQLLALGCVGAVTAYTIRVVVRVVRAVGRAGVRADEHAAAVRLVGKHFHDDTVIVESGERAAYCVGGRRPTIVVTSAAVQALHGDELAAVLAHERAHLRGRHALLIAVLRGLTEALPSVALVRASARRIPTLLEMCADDEAARRHGREPLVTGLLAMSRARGIRQIGLAAAEVAVLARARRLTRPHAPWSAAGSGAVLSGCVATMIASPVTLAVLAAAGTLWCVG